jgi:hypothetical protein
VRTKSSRIARAALAARTRTGLLSAGLVGRSVFGKVLRNAGADLRLDPSTIAAHALGLQLGDFAADPAGPFRLSLSEQTQIHVEHCGPPSPNVYGVRWEGGGQHDATSGPVVGRILEGCRRGDCAAREGNESQSECRRQPPTRINWLRRSAAQIGTVWPNQRVNKAKNPGRASRDLSSWAGTAKGSALLKPWFPLAASGSENLLSDSVHRFDRERLRDTRRSAVTEKPAPHGVLRFARDEDDPPQ